MWLKFFIKASPLPSMSDANIFLHSTLLTQTNLMYIVWTNYIIISFFLFVTGPEFYYVRKKCFCLLYTVYTDLWDIFFITTACNANRIPAFFTCIDGTATVFWIALSDAITVQDSANDEWSLRYLVFVVSLNVL